MIKEGKIKTQPTSIPACLKKVTNCRKQKILKNPQTLTHIQTSNKIFTKKDKINKSPSFKKIKGFQSNSIENVFRRSKSLINYLNKKGLRTTEGQHERGVRICEKSRQKFLKPLKMNQLTPFIVKNKIDKLCQKYQLNKQFYENPPQEFKNGILGFDPQMVEFIKNRKKSLQLIMEKKTFNPQKGSMIRRLSQVQSQKERKHTCQSTNTYPSSSLLLISKLPIVISKQHFRNETKEIILRCDNFTEIRNPDKDFIIDQFERLQENLKDEAIEHMEMNRNLKFKVKGANEAGSTVFGLGCLHYHRNNYFSNRK